MGSSNDILDTYIYENNSLLEQLETIVLDAETAGTFSQDNINEIFRIMHTIKGSSAMMEFDSLATVAHQIEDMFFLIRENTMDIVSLDHRPALFNTMFQAVDYFRREMNKVQTGQPLEQNVESFLQNITHLIAKIKGDDTSPVAESASEDIPSTEKTLITGGNADFPYELVVFYEDGCGMENLRAFMLLTSIREFCSDTDLMYLPHNIENDASTAAEIIDNGFLIMFRNKENREQAIQIVHDTASVRSCQPHDPISPPPVVETKSSPITYTADTQRPDTSGVSPAGASGTQHQKESLISVHQSKLDQLSALVGEIVITEAMVTGSPDLKEIGGLDIFYKSARQLRKLTDELQDIAMSLRMIPIAASFQKMNRIVRDMSKKLNKRVKLTIIGEDTEVDKTIVDSIGDPIMHMIRNSMDHGIEETEQDRIEAGKDPVGEIILSAQDTGSEVIITIQDDGRGVNDEAVLNKAIAQGLAYPDVEYSHKDILNFLLMPGFSTNTDVTEFSGRGVGMDVVKRGVEELGGTVTISSHQGKGMTTTIKIPLTMSIMDGMEVSVGDTIFTIPIHNIRQSFKVAKTEVLHDTVRGEIAKVMDNFYPIVRAKEMYSLPGGVDSIEDGILMWLESGDASYCLLVDELIGEQKIVVKPLPAYVNNFDIKNYGIIGCSILGDGSISIILDVAHLYNAAFGQ